MKKVIVIISIIICFVAIYLIFKWVDGLYQENKARTAIALIPQVENPGIFIRSFDPNGQPKVTFKPICNANQILVCYYTHVNSPYYPYKALIPQEFILAMANSHGISKGTHISLMRDPENNVFWVQVGDTYTYYGPYSSSSNKLNVKTIPATNDYKTFNYLVSNENFQSRVSVVPDGIVISSQEYNGFNFKFKTEAKVEGDTILVTRHRFESLGTPNVFKTHSLTESIDTRSLKHGEYKLIVQDYRYSNSPTDPFKSIDYENKVTIL